MIYLSIHASIDIKRVDVLPMDHRLVCPSHVKENANHPETKECGYVPIKLCVDEDM